MTPSEFEARLLAWAGGLSDLDALVQIGSRVQAAGVVDQWSDWDYQLIVRDPRRYLNRDWPAAIAPCWSAHFERTERGVVKLSAVFAGGYEVDFVLLSAWQIKLVCWAMRHPGVESWLPAVVSRGVRNMQLVAKPGYRVVLGGEAWVQRYSAMAVVWPEKEFSAADFDHHVTGFWRHAVWVAKKLLRGELRAALRWHQLEVREHTLALLAEEARLEGQSPRPEARQAERWLRAERLSQTNRPLSADRATLAAALLQEIELFRDVSRHVAQRRGFPMPDRSDLENWLIAELANAAQ